MGDQTVTDIQRVFNDAQQASKWKKEAQRAAELLKRDVDSMPSLKGDRVKIGFCFHDGVVTLELNKEFVRRATLEHLAAEVYRIVAQSFQPALAGPQQGAGDA